MADIGIYYAFIIGGIMSYEVVARPLRVAVLTVSDTRTLENDKGGNKVQEFLEKANHIVADRKIVIDDLSLIHI